MSLPSWTTEQMLGLAPDSLLARAAEKLANPQEWLALGRSSTAAWGEYPNANRPPYHVMATLPAVQLACDCASRKRPCRHMVGLATLLASDAQVFQEAQAPGWVLAGEREHAISAVDQADTHRIGDITDYARRLALVRQAMARLQRWLKDTVHSGLANLPTLPAAHWNEIVAMLNEAGAPETAGDIRDLRQITGSGPGWPERALRRLGRLYLLTQGFAAYDTLSIESQADLRAAAGWFTDPRHPGQELVQDDWLVLGTVYAYHDGLNTQRTWLFGQRSHRFAQLQQTSDSAALQNAYFCGTTLRAALRFAPGAWAQRADLVTLNETRMGGAAVSAYHSIRQARADFGRALSVNPWLRHFPLVFSGLKVRLDSDRWHLRDQDGYMIALPEPFLYGWHLQLLAGSPDSLIFGEWQGDRGLSPLSIFIDQRWLMLHVLRGQK